MGKFLYFAALQWGIGIVVIWIAFPEERALTWGFLYKGFLVALALVELVTILQLMLGQPNILGIRLPFLS